MINLLRRGTCLAGGFLLSVTAIVSTPLLANPQGGSVAQGSATITQSTNNTQITQSTNKAVINWQGFSIGNGQTTNFTQPSSTSITLNRVTAQNNPSLILGTLTANGRIFLVNPAGIVFGAGSIVDVAGLVASTANISDKDFMAGNYHFIQQINANGTAPAIINNGNITVSNRGLVALVAPGVENNGTINARLGRVLLASGNEYTIDLNGDNMIQFAPGAKVTQQIVAPNGRVLTNAVANNGTIIADGGTVQLSARAAESVVSNVVNMDGVIQARSVGKRNGQVILDGGNEGIVNVAGTIDVQGLMKNSTGGNVTITGQKIALNAGTKINASGKKGGGTVLVGGNYKGHGTLPEAQAVYMDPTAVINADATDVGNGGMVVVRSDVTNPNGFTAAYGTISAKGGPNGGNGGTVETSGYYLNTSATDSAGITHTINVNTSAVKGTTGDWLLDPFIIQIVPASTPSSNTTLTNESWEMLLDNNSSICNTTTCTSQLSVTDLYNSLQSNNITIDAFDTQLNAGVVIVPGPSQPTGVIDIQTSINNTSSNSLSFLAGSNIIIESGINITNVGNLNFASPVTLMGASTIQTTGASSGITFMGTIDTDPNSSAPTNLTVSSLGTVDFQGSVGSISPLNSLTVTGNAINFNDGSTPSTAFVVATGAGNVSLTAPSIAFDTTSTGGTFAISSTGGNVNIGSGTTGTTTFNGLDGSASPSTFTITTGGNVNLNGATTNVFGDDTALNITSTNNSTNAGTGININSILNNDNLFSGVAITLSGDTTIGSTGQIGINSALVQLGSVNITGTSSQTLTFNSTTGSPAINAPTINIDEPISLGVNTTISTGLHNIFSSVAAPSITLGTNAAVTGNDNNLTLTSTIGSSSNTITVDGAIEGVNNLSLLTTNNSTNNTITVGGDITNVSTLTATASGANGIINFSAPITENAGEASTVNINAGKTINFGAGSGIVDTAVQNGGVGTLAVTLTAGSGGINLTGGTAASIFAENFTSNGTLSTNSNITTGSSGNLTINNNLIVTGNTALQAGATLDVNAINGTTTINPGVNISLAGNDITLNTSLSTTSGGTQTYTLIGANASLNLLGTETSDTGAITVNSSPNVAGPITLDTNTNFISTTGNITINPAITAASNQNLTIETNGTTTLNNVTGLGTLTIEGNGTATNGQTTLIGTSYAANTINLDNAVTLSPVGINTPVTISGTNGVTFRSTITGQTSLIPALTVTSSNGSVSLVGASGLSNLIASANNGKINLTGGTFSNIGNYNFQTAVVVQGLTTLSTTAGGAQGGTINFANTLDTSNGSSLTFGQAGTINFVGAVGFNSGGSSFPIQFGTNAVNTVNFDSPVNTAPPPLPSFVTLTGQVANVNILPSNPNNTGGMIPAGFDIIGQNGTLTIGNGNYLNANDGISVNDKTFSLIGVGGTVVVPYITIFNGSNINMAGNWQTAIVSGAPSSAIDITDSTLNLTGATNFTSASTIAITDSTLNLAGATSFTAASTTAGDAILFDSTSKVTGHQALTLNALGGNTTDIDLQGTMGSAAAPLSSFTVNGVNGAFTQLFTGSTIYADTSTFNTATHLLGNTIIQGNSSTFNAPITLSGGSHLIADNTMLFNSTIGVADNAENLTIQGNTAGANVTFINAAGTLTNPLNNLTFNKMNSLTLYANLFANNISAADIPTVNVFSTNVNLLLGNQLVATGGNLNVAGGTYLVPGTNTLVPLVFTRGFNVTALAPVNIASLTASGGTLGLNGTFNALTGAMLFNGGVNLNGATNLNDTTNSITFNGALNGNQTLIANANQNATFNGMVNVGPLTVNTNTGNIAFNNSLYMNGATNLNASNGNVTLGGTVNGHQTLVVDANKTVTIANAIGNTTPITSLAINSALTNLGGNVSAQGGGIAFNSPVQLTTGVVISDKGTQGIFFKNTLNGIYNLVLNATQGNISFTGAVGNLQQLGEFVINSAQNVFAQSTIQVADFDQESGTGMTSIKAGLITNGNISINTNSIVGSFQGNNLILNGTSSVLGEVVANTLTLGGQGGGDITGTVAGESGPLAAFFTNLAAGAAQSFFVNGCLVPGGCFQNEANLTFPQDFLQDSEQESDAAPKNMPACTYAAAGDKEAASKCAAIETHPKSLLPAI